MALCLTLTACSLAPGYGRPDAPIGADYPSELDVATAPPDSSLPGWETYFGDAQLRRYIALALENNRDLRIAVAQVEAARALYGIQRSDQLPSIGATSRLTRGRVPDDLSITGQSVVSSQYEVALGISTWELDFWGRIRNLKDAALESYLASEAGRQAAQISLVAQLANAYLSNRELDERLAIAEQTLATRIEADRIMKRRYAVGASSQLDATQTEILLNQARLETAGLQRARQQGQHAMTLLIGAPVERLDLPLSRIERHFAAAIEPGLPSALLTQRPDIMAAEHQLKASYANIGAARAAFLPNISLTGGYGTASTELEGLFDSGSSAWTFVPSLNLPLFTAGRRRASLDLAQTRRNTAVAQYERAIQGAFREVSDALADRKWLAEQVGIQQQTLAAQAERARLADLRYRNGASTYLQVLDAERDRFAVEQGLVQTRRALLASSVSLYAALGGGTSAVTTP